MKYEDFYNSGLCCRHDMSVYIGWTSHKKSFCDLQPAINQTKDLYLFFAGEVFEDQTGQYYGKRENNNGGLSQLILLYEEYGIQFVEGLNGCFCGLILDTRIKKAFLFNDRYGLHRVFVHENKNGFYFSSEAKALLSVLPETRGFDPKGIGEILTCGCTLGSQTLYKNVSILPQASIMGFDNGECYIKENYFKPQKWINQKPLNEEKFTINFLESFGSIINRYTGGALPIGISLTGGLDSRMIMACLNSQNGDFPCYTFGSMYRDTLDVKIAREVAKECGQTHRVLVLGNEFINNFQAFMEKAVYISDGYLGFSGAAELYVSSLAREIAPVQLSGNHGGELLRLVRAFKPEMPSKEFVSPELHIFLYEAKETFERLVAQDSLTFGLFNLAPSIGYGRFAIGGSQLILRTPYMDNDLANLVYQAPPNLLKGPKLTTAVISKYNPRLLNIPTDRGLLDNGSRLKTFARQLYRKGLIKGEYWSSHGMPHWISDYGLGKYLEKVFLGRDKFHHFRLWTRNPLAQYIKNELLEGDRNFGEFFNMAEVENIIEEHIAGRRNYWGEIDKLLTLAITYKFIIKDESKYFLD